MAQGGHGLPVASTDADVVDVTIVTKEAQVVDLGHG
jgi:hypothetical protein